MSWIDAMRAFISREAGGRQGLPAPTNRRFVDIKVELGLKEFLETPLGTLYFNPPSGDAPLLLVRHFDGEIPVAMVAPFAGLYLAAKQWVEDRPELAPLVTITLPTEVGHDFIARQFHVYITSTWTYAFGENPPESPECLSQTRRVFRALTDNSADARDLIIEAVLARSILEPSGKTFIDGGRLVVLDPKASPAEIGRWAELDGRP